MLPPAPRPRACRRPCALLLVGALFGCARQPSPSAPSPAPVVVSEPSARPGEGSLPPPVSSSPEGPTTPLAQGWQPMGSELEGRLFETGLHGWREASQCSSFDYFPKGGIQSFWCHRPLELSLARVREMAGVDLFVAGPHSPGSLRLDAAHDFGRYNPAFARWLLDHASPAARGTPAQKATQEAYDQSMRPLAEIFFRTLKKTQEDPACFARERSLYEAGIKKKTLPRGYYERWFYFMNPGFCQAAASGKLATADAAFNHFSSRGFDGGVDGNVTKTAVGFWLRRSIDGTLPAFAEGLGKLIAAYQPELLSP